MNEVQFAQHLLLGDEAHGLGQRLMGRKMHHAQTRGHQHGRGLADPCQSGQNFLMAYIVDIACGVNGFFVNRRGDHGCKLALQTTLGRPLHGLHRQLTTAGLYLAKAKICGFGDAKVQQTPAGRGFTGVGDYGH